MPPVVDVDAAVIGPALAEAWSAAGYDPALPAGLGPRPLVRPMPLASIFRQMAIVRQEVIGLTRATAAIQVPELRYASPNLVGDQTPLAGLLWVSSVALVLVRKDDPVARRRFSAAHELGHLLMHFRPAWLPGGTDVDVVTDDTFDPAVDEQTLTNPATLDVRERQANRFAAELLMPEQVCRGLFSFYTERFGSTPRFIEGHMAGDLGVSRQAMRWRMRALDLLATA